MEQKEKHPHHALFSSYGSSDDEHTPILPCTKAYNTLLPADPAGAKRTIFFQPKTPKPTSVAESGTNRIGSKKSRQRKDIAKFRKRGGQVDYSTWRGRVGVHVKVDEFDIKALSEGILKTIPAGWHVTEHYDVMSLSQSQPSLPQDVHQGDSSMKNEQQHQQEPNLNLDDDEHQGGSSAVNSTSISVLDDAATPEVFVFSFGAVVFWNFSNSKDEEEWIEQHLFQASPDACGVSHDDEAIESACDDMNFCYSHTAKRSDQRFTIKQDVCYLVTTEAGEKLAVSFGLAKSSLLSIYQWRLERTVERNSHIPQEMATHGYIHMSRKEMTKEIGRIFLVKHGINLENALIDTPEEFWEDDRFEGTYEITLKYLDISNRLELVNNRLEMLQELHAVLVEANQNHHSVHLEWLVIWLIVAEVVLDVFHTFFY